jgi:hypothetical protein
MKVWTGFNWLTIGSSDGLKLRVVQKLGISGSAKYQLIKKDPAPWTLFVSDTRVTSQKHELCCPWLFALLINAKVAMSSLHVV